MEEKENSIVVATPKNTPNAPTMWNDAKLYNQTLQMAQQLAKSELIPQAYRNKPAECLIAIDIGNRLNLPPLVVMQNSQVVHGKFTWGGSACKAMIDGCGKYQSTYYVEIGQEGTDTYGVYLEAIDNFGNIVKGVPVTIGMAKAEGWYDRNPKWKSMGSLMLRYRASAFFMRAECASIAMGFHTKEEVEDVWGAETQTNNKASVVEMLDEEIEGEVIK